MYFFGVVLWLLPGVLLEKTVKTELSRILRFLPHIQIVSTNFEGSGEFFNFFLREQKDVSLFIGNKSLSNNKIFMSKFHRSSEMIFENVRLQSATYIHVIEGPIDVGILEDNSRKIWNERRIRNLFFVTNFGLLSYNPFKDNGSLYSLIDNDYKNSYNNLYGFPIRVQMFRSVYSILDLNETGHVRNVSGPDGKVALELQRRMNFSMVFNKPNNDFFG